MNRKQDLAKLIEKAKLFHTSEHSNYEFYLLHIRELGLQNVRQNYQEEWEFVYQDETQFGLVQEPKQFAFLLSFLENQKCTSFCEIGTNVGFSFALMLSVLSRKNKNIKVITLDPYEQPEQELLDQIRSFGVEIEHRKQDSSSVAGQQFDIVFIDGDHSYKGVKADWENVGKHSKICLFHDIIPSDMNSGIQIVYRSIPGLKTSIETTNGVMGIGMCFPRASEIKRVYKKEKPPI